MIRYVISKIVQEIVRSPQNKKFFDEMTSFNDVYGGCDSNGAINYLDKNIDSETQPERGLMEYAIDKGDFKSNWDSDSVDVEVFSSGVVTMVRGVVFVVAVGYLISYLISSI